MHMYPLPHANNNTTPPPTTPFNNKVLLESLKLKEALAAGDALPFDEIISCNIGNPQALGQKPLSFNREVLSLITNPPLLDVPAVTTLYKEDAIARARTYLAQFPLGLGPYTNSQGIDFILINTMVEVPFAQYRHTSGDHL